jgi:2-(1,2-epoxy-1,2-dihydrophenyl)acetyl-CoA isomerase
VNDFLRYEQSGRIVSITLDRPEERNAISSHAACDELVAAVARASADPGVSCLILTGAGSAFCSGANLKKMLDRDGITRADTPAATRANYKRGIQRIPLALWDCEVPTIAAVNGPAMGAGCDLACMCDIRIASEQAQFAESFLRLGLVPGDGGAWYLPRIVGLSKAAELTYTAATIDAHEALAIGLVSRVVPHAELMPAALALATRIAAQPPQALRLSKRLLRESQHARLPELLELSAALQALVHESADHTEAVQAVREKRSPIFTGK